MPPQAIQKVIAFAFGLFKDGNPIGWNKADQELNVEKV